MGNDVKTLEQLFEAYDAQPSFYALIDAGGSSERYVALTSLALWDGSDYTAVYGEALAFSSISEFISQDLEASSAQIILDGFQFDESLLNTDVEVYIGSSELDTSEHLKLFEGVVLSESRASYRLSISVQEDIYLLLMRAFLPTNQIKTEFPSAPDASFEKLLPVVIGDLDSYLSVTGRVEAIAVAANTFIICEHEFGQSFSVPALWKNGVTVAPASFTATEVNGTNYDYIQVVTTAAMTDVITVDVHRRTSEPMTELKLLLERLGVPSAKLDAASFVAAQTVATSRSYSMGGKIEEKTQALEVISNILKAFNAEAILEGGQMGVRIQNYIYDATARDLTEHAHIFKDSLNAVRRVEDIVNRFSWSALIDYAGNFIYQGVEEDSTSVTQWEEREVSFENKWAANQATAMDAAGRFIFEKAQPRESIAFTTFLVGRIPDLDDNIRVTAQNFFRQFCEIKRRTVNNDFSVQLEVLNIDDLIREAFRLGCAEDKTNPVDVRNSSVADDEADLNRKLYLLTGSNRITRWSGGLDFAAEDFKVGDFIALLFQDLAKTTYVTDFKILEIVESGLSIGDNVTTSQYIDVVDPATGLAYNMTATEYAEVWFAARSWATASTDQRIMGHLANSSDQMSDGSQGYKLT